MSANASFEALVGVPTDRPERNPGVSTRIAARRAAARSSRATVVWRPPLVALGRTAPVGEQLLPRQPG